jgi:pyruvate formate lyase activating enzyme
MARNLQVGRVQRFCLHDGPGIRTTVFLQGCGLRCWWCHNPDLRDATSAAGRSVAVDALAGELQRDARYWRASGGGVTLSGGEPLDQVEGVAELLRLLGRRGHHRCIETSLGVPPERLELVADLADLWLVDLKHAEPRRLEETTGLDMQVYMSNLRRLLETGARVELRVPLIRGFNDTPDHARLAGRLIADLPRALAVRILPGHDLGRRGDRSAAVTRETSERLRDVLREFAPDVEVLW